MIAPADRAQCPEYLAAREAQERARAELAANPAARRVHQTLAALYAERIAAGAAATST
jgi:hypothetical protein